MIFAARLWFPTFAYRQLSAISVVARARFELWKRTLTFDFLIGY
jgi:hypothetical protein